MLRIRTLLNQLRTRLILGALAFLLALTGAVMLVVRDSLQFSALDAGAQGLAETNINDILQATLLTIGYFAVLAIIGAIIAAHAHTNPIQRLVDGTRSITMGDLNVRITQKSNDEMGLDAETFN